MNNMKDKQFNTLIPLLFNVSRLIRDRTDSVRPDLVSALRLETLRFIDEKKPTMKDLSEYLRITPPSTTTLVKSLCRKKLVLQKHESLDRRTVRLSVTQLGKKSMDKFTSEKVIFLKKFFNHLTSGELKIIISILKRLQKQYQ